MWRPRGQAGQQLAEFPMRAFLCRFVLVQRELDRFFGTFLPFLRASDSPMAIACLRLLTLPPLPPRPLLSVPCERAH